MMNPEPYRSRAREARAWVEQASTPAERQAWERAAHDWDQLADLAEKHIAMHRLFTRLMFGRAA